MINCISNLRRKLNLINNQFYYTTFDLFSENTQVLTKFSCHSQKQSIWQNRQVFDIQFERLSQITSKVINRSIKGTLKSKEIWEEDWDKDFKLNFDVFIWKMQESMRDIGKSQTTLRR